MRVAPTDKQLMVLAVISMHIKEHGHPPTRQEIADKFGWSSANAAQCHLKALERKGWITMLRGPVKARHRCIAINRRPK